MGVLAGQSPDWAVDRSWNRESPGLNGTFPGAEVGVAALRPGATHPERGAVGARGGGPADRRLLRAGWRTGRRRDGRPYGATVSSPPGSSTGVRGGLCTAWAATANVRERRLRAVVYLVCSRSLIPTASRRPWRSSCSCRRGEIGAWLRVAPSPWVDPRGALRTAMPLIADWRAFVVGATSA